MSKVLVFTVRSITKFYAETRKNLTFLDIFAFACNGPPKGIQDFGVGAGDFPSRTASTGVAMISTLAPSTA
jgi:hypothetical protein